MNKLIILIIPVLLLTGCGNNDMFDTEYTFDYAECYLGGKYEKIKIEQWRTYEDGEQLQIRAKDGNVYLMSANYCRLVKSKGDRDE